MPAEGFPTFGCPPGLNMVVLSPSIITERKFIISPFGVALYNNIAIYPQVAPTRRQKS